MYAELAVTTNFSFLRGASHPHEYAEAAMLYGLPAIGIADRNTLAGVVRAYDALNQIAEEKGSAPRLLVGARLVFVDGTPEILAYPIDRAAYGRLCRLLSTGKAHAAKGECILTLDDLLQWQDGLLLAVLPPPPRIRKSNNDPFKKAWNNKEGSQPSPLVQPRPTSPLWPDFAKASSGLEPSPPKLRSSEGGGRREAEGGTPHCEIRALN